MNTLSLAFAALLPLQPLPPVDNGLLTNVPGFGPSRVETVTYCVQDAGVDKYQDLITDTHFEVFTACMTENT
jgi:hypothetical protein